MHLPVLEQKKLDEAKKNASQPKKEIPLEVPSEPQQKTVYPKRR